VKENLQVLYLKKVVFEKYFQKIGFSVRFGSSASSLTSSLNIQKNIKPLLIEYSKKNLSDFVIN
jgi:hypothetical protein